MKVRVIPMAVMSVNCLIISDEATGYGAVVDPGGNHAADKILSMATANNIEIKYILLTHAHFDHMLSLEDLREKTGAPLALHKFDAETITDPELTFMAQYGGAKEGSKPAEIILEDCDIITLGETKIEVIHTPGHTAGSVCYKSGDTIITGDTLFRGNIGRCDLYGGDEMAMDESLRRLIALAGDYKLYPGHGSTTTLSRERAENVYLRRL